ncbi:MAG TPA: hypothetical protein VIO58_08570 [Candidatus Methanoperedens sp.]
MTINFNIRYGSLMGESFPDDEEMKAIKSYHSRVSRGETEFVPLEEIDNEL